MQQLTTPELKEFALDIEIKLGQLTRLREEIDKINRLIEAQPDLAEVFYKNQALRLMPIDSLSG